MNGFPTTILLATDGSKDAELAHTTAVDLANQQQLLASRRDRRPRLALLRRSQPRRG
jgi:hypothetical protein